MEGEHSNNNPFPIHAGVRQGCVLSPRLFRSVLQWGMSVWRQNAETQKCGFDSGDHMSFLLDLPFADDILLFARTAAEAMALLDDLVHKLQNIGLQLNTGKPVVLTSKVQPPSFLHTHKSVRPVRLAAQALNLHFIHTLHAHWLQKSKKPFNCCFHTPKSCAVSSQRPNLW